MTRDERHRLVLRKLVEGRTEFYAWHSRGQLVKAIGLTRREVAEALGSFESAWMIREERGDVRATDAAIRACDSAGASTMGGELADA